MDVVVGGGYSAKHCGDSFNGRKSRVGVYYVGGEDI